MRTSENSGVNEDEGGHRERQTEGEEIERTGLAGRGGGDVTTSKLNLVDLAGSEKSVTSATAGDAAILHREGRFINKSLTFLEQVRMIRAFVCLLSVQAVVFWGWVRCKGAIPTGRTFHCFELRVTLRRFEVIFAIARSKQNHRGSVVSCCVV